MKLVSLIGIGASIAFAAACGSQSPERSATLSAADQSAAHPDFVRKLQDPANYRVNRDVSAAESICGQNDLQKINAYNGQLGQPVEFARLHKFAVGAMASSNVQGGTDKYCTGTLVGPNLFITAGHCVDSGATREFVAMNYENVGASDDLLGEDFYRITEVVENGGSLDYAVLKLEGAPGLKWGWATVRTGLGATNELITIVQHANGDPKQIEVGHLNGTSGSYYTYGDLDTEPGSSGSGIVDSRGHLFGIHTNGGCHSSGGSNSGTRLEAARTSVVLSRLNAVTLPIQDGSRTRLVVVSGGRTQALGGDVASGQLSLGSGAQDVWTVKDLADGSFRLKLRDERTGTEAWLTGNSADGSVRLVARLDTADLGAKWRVVKTDEGDFALRTVGGVDGPRWLNVNAEASGVTLGETAGKWNLAP